MTDNIPVELQSQPIEQFEHEAIRALETGTATEYQQKLALSVILKKWCRVHDLAYIPNDTHASAFMAGRQFVGKRIEYALNKPVGNLAPPTPTKEK